MSGMCLNARSTRSQWFGLVCYLLHCTGCLNEASYKVQMSWILKSWKFSLRALCFMSCVLFRSNRSFFFFMLIVACQTPLPILRNKVIMSFWKNGLKCLLMYPLFSWLPFYWAINQLLHVQIKTIFSPYQHVKDLLSTGKFLKKSYSFLLVFSFFHRHPT